MPNAQNEVVKEERLLREHLAREFLEKREKQMEETLRLRLVTGRGGGRRFVTVKQKDTVRTFLKIAMKDLEDEFRELSKLGPESMIRKEDCIIPHELTLTSSSRGKREEIWTAVSLDDKEDVRVVQTRRLRRKIPIRKIFHRSV